MNIFLQLTLGSLLAGFGLSILGISGIFYRISKQVDDRMYTIATLTLVFACLNTCLWLVTK